MTRPMTDKPAESDWKAFRALVPELRERYLCGRNAELLAVLRDDSLSPTEQFWELEERTREIAGVLRDCLEDHSRSKMVSCMMLMHRHEMLTDADLVGFSQDVRERIRRWLTL